MKLPRNIYSILLAAVEVANCRPTLAEGVDGLRCLAQKVEALRSELIEAGLVDG